MNVSKKTLASKVIDCQKHDQSNESATSDIIL